MSNDCKIFTDSDPDSIIEKVYFYFSLILLITRTSGTFLCGSLIQDSARKFYHIMRSIPSEGWHQEVERLDNDIKTETIAMSGAQFFYLSKPALFTISGTLFTYVLVLLDFNTTKEERANWVSCNQ
jgi:gustatory receptor